MKKSSLQPGRRRMSFRLLLIILTLSSFIFSSPFWLFPGQRASPVQAVSLAAGQADSVPDEAPSSSDPDEDPAWIIPALRARARDEALISRVYGDIEAGGERFAPALEPSQLVQPGGQPQGLNELVASVAAGLSFSCALTASGGVKCWGDNVWGQLGDGSYTNRLVPVDVVGLPGAIVSISALHKHVCALTDTGGVVCWGRNYHGELGCNSNLNSPVPVQVVGLDSGVSMLSVGGFHACALVADGGIQCWGYNFHGQLGNGQAGEFADSWVPVDVTDHNGVRLTGYKAVAAGKYHTCAITAADQVQCWGYNMTGQLGDGTAGRDEEKYHPVAVLDLSNAAALSLGERHSCALNASGGVKCWGGNSEGQLGVGSTDPHYTPVDVVGLGGGVAAIASGIFHTCASLDTGEAKCWGDNWAGQLGDGSQSIQVSPVTVVGFGPDQPAGQALRLAAGDSHTCSVSMAGRVFCWGSNSLGQIGSGQAANHLAATEVHALGDQVIAVSAGALHTCAIVIGGMVKCWGNNEFGQLGDGSTANRLEPVTVVGIESGASLIAAGGFHTCAVVYGGIKCWGYNASGQLGNNTKEDQLTPVNVVDLKSGVAVLAAGLEHTCAAVNGKPYCWGSNWAGQLGNDNAPLDSKVPSPMANFNSIWVSAIAAGEAHTCARSAEGLTKCTGHNYFGQLGQNTINNSEVPLPVIGLKRDVTAITAGRYHNCVVVLGAVKCWGYNASGQLGDGTLENRLTPISVPDLDSGMALVQAGLLNTCSLAEDGGLACWGDNWFGQLGDQTTLSSAWPVTATQLGDGNLSLASGAYHACAITGEPYGANHLLCWGSNSSGQLGDGSLPWQLSLYQVTGLIVPQLAVDYPDGSPGSAFHLTGAEFPPGAAVNLQVNGLVYTHTLTADALGQFTFALSTTQASLGHYIVRLSTLAPAPETVVVTSFWLSSEAPLRPPQGVTPVYDLPSGIAFTRFGFLPLLHR